MAYGKDIFRTKYRETNEGLKTAQNNYFELDHEYQMLAKIVEKAIEKINCLIEDETKETAYDRFYGDNDYTIKKLNDIKNTLKGENKDE